MRRHGQRRVLGVEADVALRDDGVWVAVAQRGLEGGGDVLGRGEDALEGGELADGARVGGEGDGGGGGRGGDGVDVGGGGEGAEGGGGGLLVGEGLWEKEGEGGGGCLDVLRG